jgi:hypothetical protein
MIGRTAAAAAAVLLVFGLVTAPSAHAGAPVNFWASVFWGDLPDHIYYLMWGTVGQPLQWKEIPVDPNKTTWLLNIPDVGNNWYFAEVVTGKEHSSLDCSIVWYARTISEKQSWTGEADCAGKSPDATGSPPTLPAPPTGHGL